MYDQILNTVTSHKHNGTNSTPQSLEEAWIDVFTPKVYPTITIWTRENKESYRPSREDKRIINNIA